MAKHSKGSTVAALWVHHCRARIVEFYRHVTSFLMNERAGKAITSVKDLITILSLILAGIWFVTKGELLLARIALQPKANMDIQCTAVRIHPKVYLLDIGIKLENKSAVVATLDPIEVQVHQILPLSSAIKERLDQGYALLLEHAATVRAR